jgi:DNA-binding NtrC family response regulator
VQFAWATVQRFRLFAELRPSDELVPMLGDVRRFVTKAGDPHAVAYMHYAVALMEASSGRTQEARRHLAVSHSLVRSYPNAWLEQLNLIASFFLDFLECNYRGAITNLERARALLAITGSRERTLIECNQAHALLVTGRFRAATERFRSVVDADAGLARLGAMEGLARVYLADGKLAECEQTLDTHDRLLARDHHLRAAFPGRWTAATRIRLLLVKKQFATAAETAAGFIKQVSDLNDRLLTAELTCLRAEALVALDLAGESARSLIRLELPETPESIGQLSGYYKARGYLTGALDPALSRDMFRRARRIWEEQGNQCALSEFKHLLDDDNGEERGDHAGSPQALLTTAMLAGALMLAHNPRLLARELSAAIAVLGCSPDVRLAEAAGDHLAVSERHSVLPLGSQKDTTLSLVCEIPSDPIKTLALSDVLRIGAAAVTLQRHSEEERNRAALWPASPVEEEAGALFIAEEMQRLLATARRVAITNVSVLLTGETGTGKEILARTIHGYSSRAKASFLPFNCTSTPKEMLDSQLFGHRRGSFTGATEHFQGIIRAAAGGTLFLDEIGDMGLDVQPKLLRFLESNEVHPVGETHPVRVDVRVVAATNANLDALVSEGRFREDLFYRLNIVRLHLPPLRERRMEIPALAQHYLQKYAREYMKGELRLAEETMEYLVLYRWPGNIRQLANEMRRMAALCESGAVLMPEHLSPEIAASRRTIPASERVLDPTEVVVRLDQPLAAATEHLERAIVQYALKQCGGRMEETAAMLGLSRKGLYLKRQRLGIDPPEHAAAVEVA